MKSILSVLCAAAVIAGCSVNGSAPVTAWGKKEVTMLDYRLDGGQCAIISAQRNSNGENGSNTAGGINGQNSAPPAQQASGSASAGSAGTGGSAGSGTPSVTGGNYRDSASPDFVNRAAMQQRSQELSEQRARGEALKSCLTSRGYTEFSLTREQRAELEKLPQGSDARRDYLYKLGTDPQVLAKQSVSK
jgi:hypothetical protein